MSERLPSLFCTHVAYADESHHNQGRYRSLCMVSLKREDAVIIRQQVHELIQKSNVSELKWSDLRDAKNRFAAMKVAQYIVQKASQKLLRIDVLLWDTFDGRHNVRGRDDNANLERMYYHLAHNVLHRRWSNLKSWYLFPDEQSAIDWVRLRDVLNQKGVSLQYSFFVHKIEPRQSCYEPLVQVADLFAGMAVWSRSNYNCYEDWTSAQSTGSGFENTLTQQLALSKADRERCMVLHDFNNCCEQHNVGITIHSSRGLHSTYPQQPVNFWWYEPQHENDVAPLKVRNHVR